MAKIEANVLDFVGGLITEATPLNFPPNATVEERNMVLLNDGTRRRRLGMDFEPDFEVIETGLLSNTPTTIYRWEDVGEEVGLDITVVQVGTSLFFHLLGDGDESISASYLGTLNTNGVVDQKFDFASSDGDLIVATGNQEMTRITYSGGEFTQVGYRILVRDFFGVTDSYTNNEESNGRIDAFLDRGNNLVYRPELLTTEHEYNLYNQGWPKKKVWSFTSDSDEKFKKEPLEYTRLYTLIPEADKEAVTNKDGTTIPVSVLPISVGHFPSNADVYSSMTSIGTVKPEEVEGFNPEFLDNGLTSASQAPSGRFVIDLFKRGESRTAASGGLVTAADYTEGGISTVEEYAGRVFYAGFNGKVTQGDDRSPKLSSYVAFSKLIEYPDDFRQCYQEADPTSKDDSALVATDGGLLRISGAKGITKLHRLSDSLVIFANNGVWQLMGSKDFGFTADNYQVVEVSDKGLLARDSVVDIGGILLYWSADGIYKLVASPDTGLLVSEDISKQSIKTIYDSVINKSSVISSFDTFDKTARWVYDDVYELVYRPDISAFSLNELGNIGIDSPTILGMSTSSPYKTAIRAVNIVAGEDNVVASVNNVGAGITRALPDTKEVVYLTKVDSGGTVNYTFSNYNNVDFIDWYSKNGVGVDAHAYMITGGMTAQDTARDKQVPYIYTHFRRTESGVREDTSGDWLLKTPSSCLLTGYWGWANSINSNKWTRPFQAYRYKRHYMPTDINDSFDTGFEVITTRNKLRGRGKSISLKFETEPLKDLQILGWSMGINIEDDA